jgi:hypothetical protein
MASASTTQLQQARNHYQQGYRVRPGTAGSEQVGCGNGGSIKSWKLLCQAAARPALAPPPDLICASITRDILGTDTDDNRTGFHTDIATPERLLRLGEPMHMSSSGSS